MLYRQLGEDRGESRTTNVSGRFVVAAAVSAAEGKSVWHKRLYNVF
jgi:hypothetical protein